MWQNFEILGTGSDLPGTGVGADEVERRAGLPAGWVERHTQVTLRYECVRPETPADMARRAIVRAMEDARLTWREIDLLIDCSTSRQQPIPCNAAILLSRFRPDADGVPGMDVQGTCLGFLLGLNVANALLADTGGTCRRILLVASEGAIAGADWNHPESATLLGDGAAAVIVGRREPQPTYFFRHETWPEHVEECQVIGGGQRLPPFDYTPERDAEFRFHMTGPRLLRIALKHLPPLVEMLLRESGFSETPVSRERLLCVPHQASVHGVEAMRRRLDIPPERFINRVANLGNMAAASIPLVIDQLRRESAIVTGNPVLLLGTSAGYSQAGMIFQV
jgi:3-oxoacyl-[acyl-carrier-protein] synthase-3